MEEEVRLGATKKISLQIPYETLKEDLEILKQKTLEFGASMAEIIPSAWVKVDERVRLKCAVPLCPLFGSNIYCPPHGFEPEFMRKALAEYSWAILYALDVIPVEHFADRPVERQFAIQWTKRNMEIAAKVETLAFGKGYYLALGLCQFNCLRVLCKQERCLVLSGDRCPFPLKARPSMEGVGIDVYGLVTKVGWEIYPIYRTVNPKEVPRALTVGIVFID